MPMRGTAKFLGVITVGLLLASPGAALAADAYVDGDTGTDAGTCASPASPCQTITYGVGQATAGATIHVDDRSGGGVYFVVAGLLLGAGKSLVADDFTGGDEAAGPEPDTIIDNSPSIGGAAVNVAAGNPAGTIQGFVIRGNFGAVYLAAAATLTGNTFDQSTGSVCLVRVDTASNAPTIGPGNTFADPTPATPGHTGVCVVNDAAPEIASNTFRDLNRGVDIDNGDPDVVSNTFTGIRGATSDAAIEVDGGFPLITGNVIDAPGDPFVGGIALRETALPVGAMLQRNSILGHRFGIVVSETQSPVELNGDLIAGSANAALAIVDMNDNGDAQVRLTNVTIADSGSTNVTMANGALVLGSTIIAGSGGGITASGASPVCQIAFSRGPAIAPGNFGCTGFQTTASPGFINGAGGDYHLATGSAMIDAGDPAAPVAGVLDIDGEARVTDGDGDGSARRDIGADEAGTLTPQLQQPPATTGKSPPRKCKRKKAKRRVALAKKKRCKKKRRPRRA